MFNMSKEDLLSLLTEHNACEEAVEWVKSQESETFSDIWNACERADWMLWLLVKMIDDDSWPSHETVVLCACDCAETALKYVPEGEERPKKAIETARLWVYSKATVEDCRKAAAAAYAAAAAAYTADAAAYTADAAAYAAAAAAAYANAWDAAMREMAELIRKRTNFNR